MPGWDNGFVARSVFHETLAPFAEVFANESAFPSCEALSALAAAHARVVPPPRFEVQRPKPRRRDRDGTRTVEVATRYDGLVALTGAVPTRPSNWHDFYNALVFIAFSRAKRALHARQFAAARAAIPEGAVRVPGRRTREQDHLTILDEGSVLVACAPGTRSETEQALRAVGTDAIGAQTPMIVFGHAVYEHFHFGRPALRAMTVVLELERSPSLMRGRELVEALDDALTTLLETPDAFRDPTSAFSITLG